MHRIRVRVSSIFLWNLASCLFRALIATYRGAVDEHGERKKFELEKHLKNEINAFLLTIDDCFFACSLAHR